MSFIAQKLHQARTERGLNLRELAQSSGLSASMLCTIEKGKTMPSVQSLMAIASALDVPPSYFFFSNDVLPEQDASAASATLQTEPVCPVLRSSDRQCIHLAGGVHWARLTPGQEKGIEISELHYEAGANAHAEYYTHTGREWGQVLEGEMCLDLGFETYRLTSGDCITFDSQIPHRLRNDTEMPFRALWVNYR